MATGTIKQRLSEGKEVRVTILGSMVSPRMVEFIGMHANLHGIWFDQEHARVEHNEMGLLLMAARSVGLDPFVRVPPTDYASMMRPMELGASGIMVPQIRTPQQVQQAVQWAKYPPLGVRGLFQSNFESGYGRHDAATHIEQTNRDRWLCIQIETAESVDCVDEIVNVEGVDYLFVGPGDLACTLGVPGQPMHAKCIAALEKLSKAVKAAGKVWGVLPASVEHATLCRQLGCKLFSFSSDADLLRRGLGSVHEEFADFF